jgi:hypothetical protein
MLKCFSPPGGQLVLQRFELIHFPFSRQTGLLRQGAGTLNCSDSFRIVAYSFAEN